MDVRINEVQSQVHTTDSQSLLDPRILRQIVRACMEAMNDKQEREKRENEERRLSAGVSDETY
jgi:hypothetical protein